MIGRGDCIRYRIGIVLYCFFVAMPWHLNFICVDIPRGGGMIWIEWILVVAAVSVVSAWGCTYL